MDRNKKNVAVIGLGLIGASLAKTIKLNTGHAVYGYDISGTVVSKALSEGVIDGEATAQNLKKCGIVIVCLYPSATIDFVKTNVRNFMRGAVVIDCAGVKTNICAALSPLCKENDCYFVGGHPMAGIEKSGYDFSFAHMFDGATMVLCRDENTNTVAIAYAKMFFESLGFGKITYSTPVEHDEAIAFTSQLAHVVSNAYIQSEQAAIQGGFSGGSYKDLTRVAYLNETMWTELFIENKVALGKEVRSLIQRLEKYADYIENSSEEELKAILKKGAEAKVIVG